MAVKVIRRQFSLTDTTLNGLKAQMEELDKDGWGWEIGSIQRFDFAAPQSNGVCAPEFRGVAEILAGHFADELRREQLVVLAQGAPNECSAFVEATSGGLDSLPGLDFDASRLTAINTAQIFLESLLGSEKELTSLVLWKGTPPKIADITDSLPGFFWWIESTRTFLPPGEIRLRTLRQTLQISVDSGLIQGVWIQIDALFFDYQLTDISPVGAMRYPQAVFLALAPFAINFLLVVFLAAATILSLTGHGDWVFGVVRWVGTLAKEVLEAIAEDIGRVIIEFGKAIGPIGLLALGGAAIVGSQVIGKSPPIRITRAIRRK